jgi:hypothetical protein
MAYIAEDLASPEIDTAAVTDLLQPPAGRPAPQRDLAR